jgi:hypothetical protein
MHSLPSPKAYYFAAFILGSLIALLIAAPARAIEAPSLDHVIIAPSTPGPDYFAIVGSNSVSLPQPV